MDNIATKDISANLWSNIVEDNIVAKELLANLCRCNIVQAFQHPAVSIYEESEQNSAIFKIMLESEVNLCSA